MKFLCVLRQPHEVADRRSARPGSLSSFTHVLSAAMDRHAHQRVRNAGRPVTRRADRPGGRRRGDDVRW